MYNRRPSFPCLCRPRRTSCTATGLPAGRRIPGGRRRGREDTLDARLTRTSCTGAMCIMLHTQVDLGAVTDIKNKLKYRLDDSFVVVVYLFVNLNVAVCFRNKNITPRNN